MSLRGSAAVSAWEGSGVLFPVDRTVPRHHLRMEQLPEMGRVVVVVVVDLIVVEGQAVRWWHSA